MAHTVTSQDREQRCPANEIKGQKSPTSFTIVDSEIFHGAKCRKLPSFNDYIYICCNIYMYILFCNIYICFAIYTIYICIYFKICGPKIYSNLQSALRPVGNEDNSVLTPAPGQFLNRT